MTIDRVIAVLKMNKELICFDPVSGEKVTPVGINRESYDAFVEAIRYLNDYKKLIGEKK